MYKVIRTFKDLKDNNYKYSVGDEYPRTGLVVSEKRLRELSTRNNKRGLAVIAEQNTPENTSPLPEKTPLNVETDESTIKKPKAKRKPRKSHVEPSS